MKKTFMFTDLDYIQHMYPTILKIQKFTTYNQVHSLANLSVLPYHFFLSCTDENQELLFLFLICRSLQHDPRPILSFTYSQVRAIFGFTPSDNIGKSAFPAVQACPAFPSTFHIPLKGSLDMPCLIPCAIDQVRTIIATTLLSAISVFEDISVI
jgi:hypothetical protein